MNADFNAQVAKEIRDLKQQINVLKENHQTLLNRMERMRAQIEKLQGVHGR